MTILRRAVLLSLMAGGCQFIVAAAAYAAAPTIATAPGRVVIDLAGGQVADNDSSGGAAGSAVALPDGGVVALTGGSGGQQEVIALTRDGAIDTSFGTGGTAIVPTGVNSLVRQPDGKFVLLGAGAPASDLQFPQLFAVRLDADGALDPSFGVGGVATLPIQQSCTCTAIAQRPGGGYVVDGSTGGQSPEITTNPEAAPQTQWVVAGLTPSGALDPSFGQAGIAPVGGIGSNAGDLAVLPDGDIVTDGQVSLGNFHYESQVTELLPSGAPDPAFNGGTPQTLPAIAAGLLADPNGTVSVEVQHAIIRYLPSGQPDQTFGSGGIVQIGSSDADQGFELLPSGDGFVLVVGNAGHDQVEGIAANGAVGPPPGEPAGLSFDLPFGGGNADLVTTIHASPLLPLDQNTFNGNLIQRPDGSYVLVGGVDVSAATGEGEGRSINDLAVAALTPSFAPDTSFGGPVTMLRATVAVPPQRASTARARHGIRVVLRVSAPGLARVVIKASGRVVAHSVVPVFGTAPTTLPVELTSFGSRWLKGHPRSRLTLAVKARDLLTTTTTSTASGALR
jgi:uncharacterized delta-60 repeat protein